MDLYSLIKNKVMGVLNKKTTKKSMPHLTELSNDELKYLITLIGKSDFKGVDLQIVYTITAKLQNQLKK
jgi:hypothetical protein